MPCWLLESQSYHTPLQANKFASALVIFYWKQNERIEALKLESTCIWMVFPCFVFFILFYVVWGFPFLVPNVGSLFRFLWLRCVVAASIVLIHICHYVVTNFDSWCAYLCHVLCLRLAFILIYVFGLIKNIIN